MEFSINDSVQISPDSKYYGLDPAYNPANVDGIIIDIVGAEIQVEWHGEFTNIYKEDDLVLSESIVYDDQGII